MGCDYYIIKRLKIEHSSGVDFVELNKKRCYFPEHNNDNDYNDDKDDNNDNNDNNDNDDSDDSDDSDDTLDFDIKYQRYLEVTFVPRILYQDWEWKNEKVKKKYIDMVYEKLKHYNNAYDNIYQITKEELRHFR